MGAAGKRTHNNWVVKLKYSRSKDKLALIFKGLTIVSLDKIHKELFPNAGMHKFLPLTNQNEDTMLEH